MKAVIQRNLPLDTKYSIIDKKYIPLEISCGAYCCENCNKLIANIATVRDESGKNYNIGFDCLETMLLNNSLLSTNDVAEYERIKKMIPKILRFSKHLKELVELNNGLLGFDFERPSEYFSEYITYYLIKIGNKPYNTYVKLKEVDFDFLIETLKNIFKDKLIINII